jgi:ribosomal protein S1
MEDKMQHDSVGAESKEDWEARREMEALFAQEEGLSKKISSREIVWANVISATPEGVWVDIGEKREGFIPASDFTFSAPKKNLKSPDLSKKQHKGPKDSAASLAIEMPKSGEKIAVLYAGKRSDGTTLLSHRKAKMELSWEGVAKSFREHSRVSGKVVSGIKGGFLVDISGVTAFLPTSLADFRPVFNAETLLNKTIECYIIDLNESDKRVVVSRKAILEEQAAQRRAKIFSEIEAGQVRFGRISKTAVEGLTIDIGGFKGLIRPEDIAWGETSTPLYKRGDKLRVKVVSKILPETDPNKPEGAVYFGIKQLLPNPAELLRKKYPTGAIVIGTVISIDSSGAAFKVISSQVKGDRQKPVAEKVKKGSPVVAFCPASQMDEEAPKVGDEVGALVSGVDAKTFRLLVSIKRYNEKQERARVAQYLKAPSPLTLGDILSTEE